MCRVEHCTPPYPVQIPMKRCGTIAEMAALVGFIASKDCSFTTGEGAYEPAGRGVPAHQKLLPFVPSVGFTFDATGGRATY